VDTSLQEALPLADGFRGRAPHLEGSDETSYWTRSGVREWPSSICWLSVIAGSHS